MSLSSRRRIASLGFRNKLSHLDKVASLSSRQGRVLYLNPIDTL
jgi:hypothetical protein